MMDDLYYDALDLLRELIATPRISREETAAASLLERRMKEWGLEPRRSGNNLIVVDNEMSAERPTVLLNSHIDTVRPVSGWTHDPFTPLIDPDNPDRLYGLGSNDAGASLTTLLAAYRALTARTRSCNYIFVASAEEEVSGRGGIESVIPTLPPISYAVVGEPTGMRPAVTEKGLMVLDGIARGVAGHAARGEGVNAIYRAIEAIDRLRNLSFGSDSPTLGPVRLSVTQIEAGTQHNIVPDECRFVVDVRTTDRCSNLEALKLIREATEGLCQLTPRSTRLNPSSIATDNKVVTRAAMLGLEPFGSPTLSDRALMPWPSVKIGPGDSARSHTADEYILLSELREAIEIYLRLLA